MQEASREKPATWVAVAKVMSPAGFWACRLLCFTEMCPKAKRDDEFLEANDKYL